MRRAFERVMDRLTVLQGSWRQRQLKAECTSPIRGNVIGIKLPDSLRKKRTAIGLEIVLGGEAIDGEHVSRRRLQSMWNSHSRCTKALIVCVPHWLLSAVWYEFTVAPILALFSTKYWILSLVFVFPRILVLHFPFLLLWSQVFSTSSRSCLWTGWQQDTEQFPHWNDTNRGIICSRYVAMQLCCCVLSGTAIWHFLWDTRYSSEIHGETGFTDNVSDICSAADNYSFRLRSSQETRSIFCTYVLQNRIFNCLLNPSVLNAKL